MDSVVQRGCFDHPSEERSDRARSDPVSRGHLVPARLLGLCRATGLQKILENRPERPGKCSPPVLQRHDPGKSHNPERQETARALLTEGELTDGQFMEQVEDDGLVALAKTIIDRAEEKSRLKASFVSSGASKKRPT